MDHDSRRRSATTTLQETDPGRYIALLDLGAVSLGLAEPKKARERLEAAMALGRSLGVGEDQTLLVNLAEIWLLEGDHAQPKISMGRRYASEATCRRTGRSYACLGLALCATADGDNEVAAKLHGLADFQLKALGYVWAPENLAFAGGGLVRLKSVMGSEQFEEAFAAGESWDIEEALRLISASA